MTIVKNSGKKQKLDVLSLIEKSTEVQDTTEWSGSLRDYLPLVVENLNLNELAHSRICRMVESEGVVFEKDDERKENPHYKFFKNDLFGVDHVLAQIMQYFRSASAGSEVSRRILLLWGPTSSGKSQFAILLKKGLEAFSKTKEGATYAIDGCPMFENPLNAIPEVARKSLLDQFGLVIDGELCPRCAYRLRE